MSDENLEVGGPIPDSPSEATATAQAPKKRGRPKGSKNRAKAVEPSSLTPDLGELGEAPTNLDTKFFWVGLFPECPESAIHLAGVTFQKMSERLYRKSGQERMQRAAQVGGIQKITRAQLERLAGSISRTVIRFQDEPIPVRDDDIELVQTLSERGPVRGHCLTVPKPKTAEEREEASKYLRNSRPYQPSRNDRNVAHYLYCVPCDNQERPSGSNYLPEPVSVTGLQWPED